MQVPCNDSKHCGKNAKRTMGGGKAQRERRTAQLVHLRTHREHHSAPGHSGTAGGYQVVGFSVPFEVLFEFVPRCGSAENTGWLCGPPAFSFVDQCYSSSSRSFRCVYRYERQSASTAIPILFWLFYSKSRIFAWYRMGLDIYFV